MSTSKTSAKPAAGAAKGIDKAAIRKVIEAQRAIPGAKNSAKFASRAQKSKYINHKRDALKAKKTVGAKSTSFKRMITRAKIQKSIKAQYKKKVEQAAKDKKPVPAAPYVSRVEKKLKQRAAKRKTSVEQKQTNKKARVAAADAFVKSLGPNPDKAFVAKGRKVPADVAKKAAAKPLSKRQAKFKKNAKPVSVWGKASAGQFRAGASSKAPRALTLKGVVRSIEKGLPLRKSAVTRGAEIKAKVKANNAAARKAALEKRGGKPAKVNPKAAEKLAKFKAAAEKRTKKWEAKKAVRKDAISKRAEDKKKGLKVKKVAKKAVKKPFKAHKKIHIVNLDRMERSVKKNYSRSQAKLRSSIKPGTVVILLKGKYAGRRAIFLRQLPVSRDLLVTGPFSVNGVPLYRISQSFVIATSTRIDIKNMPNLKSSKLSDSLFKVQRAAKKANPLGEIQFFSPDTKKKPQANLHRKPIQKATDKFLVPIIKKTPLLKEYLQSSFSVSDKDAPHRMAF